MSGRAGSTHDRRYPEIVSRVEEIRGDRLMSATAVIQTAFIGDVVLATPLFEAARRSRPGDRIIAVVRPGCEDILGNNPFVDEILVWDKRGKDGGFFAFAGRLRKKGIDTALVPHRSLRTALALVVAGIPVRVGFSRGGGSFLHTVRVPYRYGIHEVERNLMLARAAGWQADGLRPAIFPDDGDRAAVDAAIAGIGEFCVFAPGSVWPTKMWPAESYIETGRSFADRGIAVVLIGGNADRMLCEGIASGIPRAVNLTGRLSLRQSAELCRRARFVLTGDSAPQHLAAAAGARVYSIFGPTVREFGFTPYTDRGTVIEQDLDCRPCGAHGHERCPKRTLLCMRRITPQTVLRIIGEPV